MTKNYRQSHHFWKIMRHASKTPSFKEETVSEIWKCLEQSDNKVWYICCVSAAHAKRNCLASRSSIRNKHWTLIVYEWLEKIRIKIVEENPDNIPKPSAWWKWNLNLERKHQGWSPQRLKVGRRQCWKWSRKLAQMDPDICIAWEGPEPRELSVVHNCEEPRSGSFWLHLWLILGHSDIWVFF